MTPLDRRAADLQDIIQDILKQFQCVNTANGPHRRVEHAGSAAWSSSSGTEARG